MLGHELAASAIFQRLPERSREIFGQMPDYFLSDTKNKFPRRLCRIKNLFLVFFSHTKHTYVVYVYIFYTSNWILLLILDCLRTSYHKKIKQKC